MGAPSVVWRPRLDWPRRKCDPGFRTLALPTHNQSYLLRSSER
jgi:hypothetical protein